MLDILIQAGCFIAIIVLGYVLRKIGVFQAKDFTVLSKIVLKITLPAAIVTNFAGKEIDPAMLSVALLGLGGGLLYVFLGLVLNRKGGKEQQAFAMLNTAGYNIGNFTLPFVQGFLGPMGVITTSLFDVGNSCITLGGAYSMASIVKENSRFSITKILKKLSTSVAFDCCIIMLVLSLLHLSLPAPILSFAQIVANSNAFMAMFMIGVGFKLSGDRSQAKMIVKVLSVRYGIAVLFALGCFFLLPFEREVRVALMILVFSPIASSAPAFTETMKGDVGLASAINSISIICSIIFIVTILVVML